MSARGAQISDVALARPTFARRAPPQTDGDGIPTHGIGLVVATDNDRRLQRRPMLSLPLTFHGFLQGSAPAGSPMIALAWFHDHGRTFVVTVKLGAHAYNDRELKTVDRLLRSIR